MPAVGDPILAEDLLHAVSGSVALAASSTTLQNVTGLSVSVPASTVYAFRGVFFASVASGTTEDIKYGFTFPTGAQLRAAGTGGTTGGVTGGSASDVNLQLSTFTSGTTTQAFGLSTSVTMVVFEGILTMSTTAGTFQVQAAQNTSGLNVVTVAASSYIMLTRIG